MWGYDAIKLIAACNTHNKCFIRGEMRMSYKASMLSITSSLEDKSTYQIEGKSFVVTPVFREDGHETLGEVLLRLMQAENALPHP